MTPRPWLLAALGCAVISIIVVQGTGPAAFAADRDCGDFSTQQQAQSFFEANGRPSSDPHQFDGDGDGKACEDLPCPCGSGAGDGGNDVGAGGGSPDPPRDLTDGARVTDIADGDTIEVRVPRPQS